jgi:DNA-binding transcriptional regulator YiaG
VLFVSFVVKTLVRYVHSVSILRIAVEVDADLIRDTRERMHVSRAVFARRLRASTRTLENWEQGRFRQPSLTNGRLLIDAG